jgi:hypothetical protein
MCGTATHLHTSVAITVDYSVQILVTNFPGVVGRVCPQRETKQVGIVGAFARPSQTSAHQRLVQ